MESERKNTTNFPHRQAFVEEKCRRVCKKRAPVIGGTLICVVQSRAKSIADLENSILYLGNSILYLENSIADLVFPVAFAGRQDYGA